MDGQAIGGIVGVLSAAIAALGLLLTWYRNEAPPRRRGRRQVPRPWYRWMLTRAGIAVSLGLMVCIMASAGTVLIALAPSSSGPSSGTASPVRPVNELQYRSQVARLCLDSDEEARRIEKTNPQNTVLGVNVDVEKRLVDKIRQVVPPASLKSAHDDLLAAWDQRIALLEAVYQELDQP